MRWSVLSGNSLRLTINFPLFPAASVLYLRSEVTLTKVSFFYWILSSLIVTESSGSSYARWAEATFSPWGLCLGVTQSWVPPQGWFTPCSFQDASCRDVQPHQAAWALHAFPFVLANESGFNCSCHSCSISGTQHLEVVCAPQVESPWQRARWSQRWKLLQRLYWFLGLFCSSWAW